jgi:hypothetical protein
MKNRKQIDLFLIGLDNFIREYYDINEDLYDIHNILIPIFKANNKNTTSIDVNKKLDIPNLTLLCNREKNTYLTKKVAKSTKRIMSQRTDVYVRKVAYKFEYKEVKDLSYEHIFIKTLINSSELARVSIPHTKYDNQLQKHDLKTFIIPELWYHDDSLIFY